MATGRFSSAMQSPRASTRSDTLTHKGTAFAPSSSCRGCWISNRGIIRFAPRTFRSRSADDLALQSAPVALAGSEDAFLPMQNAARRPEQNVGVEYVVARRPRHLGHLAEDRAQQQPPFCFPRRLLLGITERTAVQQREADLRMRLPDAAL